MLTLSKEPGRLIEQWCLRARDRLTGRWMRQKTSYRERERESKNERLVQFIRAYKKRGRGVHERKGLITQVNKMKESRRLVVKGLRKRRWNKDRWEVNGSSAWEGREVTSLCCLSAAYGRLILSTGEGVNRLSEMKQRRGREGESERVNYEYNKRRSPQSLWSRALNLGNALHLRPSQKWWIHITAWNCACVCY